MNPVDRLKAVLKELHEVTAGLDGKDKYENVCDLLAGATYDIEEATGILEGENESC